MKIYTEVEVSAKKSWEQIKQTRNCLFFYVLAIVSHFMNNIEFIFMNNYFLVKFVQINSVIFFFILLKDSFFFNVLNIGYYYLGFDPKELEKNKV